MSARRAIGIAFARDRQRGQTLVEFSIALIPFLFLLMGVVDLGRGIYTNNGVAQAAREIARAASVHPCTGACSSATWSPQIVAAINTQRGLVPGLAASGVAIDCVNVANTVLTVGEKCPSGQYVRVTATVSFALVTPFLPVANPFTVSSTAHLQVP